MGIGVKTKRLRYGLVFGLAKIVAPHLYRKMLQGQIRGMMYFMRNKYRDASLVGVELGVYRANYSVEILKNLSMEKLFLVDPYLPYVDGDGAVWNPSETDFHIAQKNVAQYKQCQFIKKSSIEAAKDLPDNLDFVYIDANHNYEPAKADIETYYPKVKVGGVIGGHDFHSDFQGVINAVVDFSRQIGAKLYVEQFDWWIVK